MSLDVIIFARKRKPVESVDIFGSGSYWLNEILISLTSYLFLVNTYPRSDIIFG
jgi:hypothetical protein